jgi:hypothetical protein
MHAAFVGGRPRDPRAPPWRDSRLRSRRCNRPRGSRSAEWPVHLRARSSARPDDRAGSYSRPHATADGGASTAARGCRQSSPRPRSSARRDALRRSACADSREIAVPIARPKRAAQRRRDRPALAAHVEWRAAFIFRDDDDTRVAREPFHRFERRVGAPRPSMGGCFVDMHDELIAIGRDEESAADFAAPPSRYVFAIATSASARWH